MDQELRRLREQIAARRSHGHIRPRFDAATRNRVVAFAEGQRASGISYQKIAGDLGLSVHTVQRWCHRALKGAKLRAVRVTDEAAPTTGMPTKAVSPSLTLTTPAGYRIEGLDVSSAAALVGALS
jgi:transposase-like protein